MGLDELQAVSDEVVSSWNWTSFVFVIRLLGFEMKWDQFAQFNPQFDGSVIAVEESLQRLRQGRDVIGVKLMRGAVEVLKMLLGTQVDSKVNEERAWASDIGKYCFETISFMWVMVLVRRFRLYSIDKVIQVAVTTMWSLRMKTSTWYDGMEFSLLVFCFEICADRGANPKYWSPYVVAVRSETLVRQSARSRGSIVVATGTHFNCALNVLPHCKEVAS
jgi:hypothetical protein